MPKTKDGFYKDHQGLLNNEYALLAGGGHLKIGNAVNNIPLSNNSLNIGLDADKLDGYHANELFQSFTNGENNVTNIKIGDTTLGLAIDADKLDGHHASYFQIATSKSYNSVNARPNYPDNEGWYNIFKISDQIDGTCICNIKTYAYSSLTFIVSYSSEFDPNTPYGTLQILQSNNIYTDRYLTVKGVRLLSDGKVQILLWNSTNSFINNSLVDITINIFSTTGQLVPNDILTLETGNPTIIKSLIGETGKATTDIVGNASTASKWETPRTFTLGNTGKLVDGSQDMRWTLEEIGAAPSSIVGPYFVEGNSADNIAGTWTGSHPDITSYFDGLTIIYVPKIAGASTTTLNINNLGATTCYYTGNSQLTTQYSVGTPILLTYTNNGWRRADFGNTDTHLRVFRQIDNSTWNQDYPLLASRHLLSEFSNTNDSYLDIFGLIGVSGKVPTINPITGELKAVKFTGEIDQYETGLFIGDNTNNKATVATTNGNTYIKLFDSDTIRSKYKISGTDIITVSTDGSGNITIGSTGNFSHTHIVTIDSTDYTIPYTSKVTLPNNRKAFYGTCSTVAGTAAKVVTLNDTTGWELKAGTIVGVKFTNTNSASSITLNVNNSGAKQVYYNGSQYTSTASWITGEASKTIYYMYNGTQWEWINVGYNLDTHYTSDLYIGAITTSSSSASDNPYIKLFDNSTLREQYQIKGSDIITVKSDGSGNITIGSTGNFSHTHIVTIDNTDYTIPYTGKVTLPNNRKAFYCTCATTAGTAAKVVTLNDTTGWELKAGTIVGVKFTNTNSASSITLNVNNSGAKQVYYNGSRYTSTASWITGEAGKTIYYMYNGTQWEWLNTGYNLDSHYTTHLYIGAASAASSATQDNPYIKLFDNTSLREQYQIKGEGVITVKSDGSGNITIGSTGQYTHTHIVTIDSTDYTIPYTGKVTLPNNRKVFYGTCATAAGTTAKVVTLNDTTGWELKAGTIIGVKFTNTNSASSITLNVNNSGAKEVYYNGSRYTSTASWITGEASKTIYYMYNGTQWEWLNTGYNLDTHYTSDLYIGASGNTSISALSNPYIKLYENSSLRHQYQIKGSGSVTVQSDGSGNITISGTDTDTHYASFLRLGAINTTTNAATTNGNTYLKLIENGSVKETQIKIIGTGNVTVTSDATGILTINGATQDSSHYITSLIIGDSSNNKSTAATTNGNTYIKLFDDNTIRNKYKISGSDIITVTSDGSGNITIGSTGDFSHTHIVTIDSTDYTIPYTGKVTLPNNRKAFYGTCATAAGTAAKVVTLNDTTGWELKAGTIVGVKFTNTNSASNITLNVNSSGAKQIYYNGSQYTSTASWITGNAGKTIYYMYNGTQWEWLNAGYNLDTHYTSDLYIGAASTTSSSSLNDPYIKLYDNSSLRHQYQIKGGDGITVESDGSGNITITNSAPNIDEKVTQNSVTNSANYRLLFKCSANDTNETNISKYATTLYYNPSTKVLTSPYFTGKITITGGSYSWYNIQQYNSSNANPSYYIADSAIINITSYSGWQPWIRGVDSENGSWTIGQYTTNLHIGYIPKSNTTNSLTKNWQFSKDGTLTSPNGFIHGGFTPGSGLTKNSYILLAGGGYKAISDFSLSGHNHDDRYVTVLGTSSNYLTWTKNGTTNNITIPYATLAGTIKVTDKSTHPSSGSETFYIPMINVYSGNATVYGSSDFFMYRNSNSNYLNIGKSGITSGITFHTVGESSGAYGDLVAAACTAYRKWTLPDKTGTIALTSDIPSNYDDRYVLKTGDTMTGSLIFNYKQDVGLIKNTYGSTIYNLIRNHNNGNISLSASSGGLYIGYENTLHQHFYTNGNEKITILQGGNIGINKTSPEYQLDITGSIRSSNSGKFGNVLVGGYSLNSTESNANIEFLTGSGYIDWHYGGSTADYTTRLIENSSGNLTLYGNLGLSRNPSYKLDVNGDIRMGSQGSEAHLYGYLTNNNQAFLSIYNDPNGYGLRTCLGGGGCTVVGAGESAHEFAPNYNDENLYLIADNNVEIYTNVNTYANRINAATFNTNGDTYLHGNLYLGRNTSNNFIAFYGTYGDAAGSYVTSFIGEHLWGSTESSELLLMKFNDAGNNTSGTTISGAGPDRIRHLAHAHVFQIMTNSTQNDFATMANSTAYETKLEICKNCINSFTSIILKGSTTADMSYSGNVHPYIRFDNSDSLQNVSLIFTDYDSYRSPAGIKLIGNQGGEWFEAPHIYSQFHHISHNNDDAVLLAGGGWKSLSDFGTSSKLYWADIEVTSSAVTTAIPNFGGIKVGDQSANYHFVMGTGSYTWFDHRKSDNSVANNIVMYDSYTHFGKSITVNGNAELFTSNPGIILNSIGTPWPFIKFRSRAGGTTYITTAYDSWAELYYQIPAKIASNSNYYPAYFFFRQYSHNGAGARVGYYEDYRLPETNKNRDSNASYNILTTKNTYVSSGKGYINGTEITQVNNATNVYIEGASGDVNYAMLFTTATANGNGRIYADTQWRTAGITFNPSTNILRVGSDIIVDIKRGTADNSIPTSGSALAESHSNQATFRTALKNTKSYIGSTNGWNGWQNVISCRHRNGNSDGNNYGMYIRTSLTDTTDNLVWDREHNNVWQGERTILDTGNWTGIVDGRYVLKAGDTMTGNLSYKTSINAKVQNNNVSSTQYPTTFNILDTNGYIITRLESVVESSGNISAYLYVRQYNASGSNVLQKGLKIISTKNLSGNTFTATSYIETPFGVNGQNTSYTFYVNGSSDFSNRLVINSSGQVYPYDTNTRRAGMYGNYDSYKIAHIWSIGTSYMIPDNGSNFGNLYGLAYKHTNNSTGGTMATGHQVVWCDNGNPRAAMGYGGFWTLGTYRVQMDTNSSNAKDGLEWTNTSNTVIGSIQYHNTVQRIIINSIGSASTWDDTFGKSSLRIGKEELTFNGFVVPHTYPLVVYNGTSTSSYWRKLGTFTTAGNSNNMIIDIFTGPGYNGTADQNVWCRIMIKDGWQSSPSVNNCLGITVEQFGYPKFSYKDQNDNEWQPNRIQVRVNVTSRPSNSQATGDLWILCPWDYANGNYTVSGHFAKWTHNGAAANNSASNGNQTSFPTHNQNPVQYMFNVSHMELGRDNLTGWGGSFFFGGNTTLFSGEDYVGLQAGNNYDKWQLVAAKGNLNWRQNDTGNTNTSFGSWRIILDSSNYTSYVRKLPSWYDNRPSNINVMFGDGALRTFVATSSTTTGKPDSALYAATVNYTGRSTYDAHILHMAWDSTNKWDAQLALADSGSTISIRGMNGSGWNPWRTLYHEDMSLIPRESNVYKIGHIDVNGNPNNDRVWKDVAFANFNFWKKVGSNNNSYDKMYSSIFMNAVETNMYMVANQSPVLGEKIEFGFDPIVQPAWYWNAAAYPSAPSKPLNCYDQPGTGNDYLSIVSFHTRPTKHKTYNCPNGSRTLWDLNEDGYAFSMIKFAGSNHHGRLFISNPGSGAATSNNPLVNLSAYFYSANATGAMDNAASYTWLNIQGITQRSDIKIKKNIKNIDSDELSELYNWSRTGIKQFDYKDFGDETIEDEDYNNNSIKSYGIIAQELETILPQAVADHMVDFDPNLENHIYIKAVNYQCFHNKLFAALINEIEKLKLKVNELENRLN